MDKSKQSISLHQHTIKLSVLIPRLSDILSNYLPSEKHNETLYNSKQLQIARDSSGCVSIPDTRMVFKKLPQF